MCLRNLAADSRRQALTGYSTRGETILPEALSFGEKKWGGGLRGLLLAPGRGRHKREEYSRRGMEAGNGQKRPSAEDEPCGAPENKEKVLNIGRVFNFEHPKRRKGTAMDRVKRIASRKIARIDVASSRGFRLGGLFPENLRWGGTLEEGGLNGGNEEENIFAEFTVQGPVDEAQQLCAADPAGT